MNYGDIKHNLISLVFGEESDLAEVEELGYLYDSLNRAISEIGVQFPYVETYQFDITKEDEEIGELLYIDMTDIDDMFLDFGDPPVLYEKNNTQMYRKFSDYEIENKRTLVIDPKGNIGSYRVFYKCDCEQITSKTRDNHVPELPNKVHYLIPILTAYWLWKDDDSAKAAEYRNIYEQKIAELMNEENKPRAKVYPNNEWGVI